MKFKLKKAEENKELIFAKDLNAGTLFLDIGVDLYMKTDGRSYVF